MRVIANNKIINNNIINNESESNIIKVNLNKNNINNDNKKINNIESIFLCRLFDKIFIGLSFSIFLINFILIYLFYKKDKVKKLKNKNKSINKKVIIK